MSTPFHEPELVETDPEQAEARIIDAIESGSSAVDISRSRLAGLPQSLLALSDRLRWLNARDNHISRLPNWIADFPFLTHLDVSGNAIGELPTELGGLSSLQALDVSRNRYLHEVPDSFSQLDNLMELDISDNDFEVVPEELQRLPITKLAMSDNNITELPDWIHHLKELQTLIVQRNKIHRIDDTVGVLNHLAVLDASENQLETVSAKLGNLGSLVRLVLAGNKNLGNLPASLADLRQLEELNVSNIGAKRLPNWKGTALKMVYAAYNQLTAIPDWLQFQTSLISLDVSYNKIRAIDGWIGAHSSLMILVLSGNPMKLPAAVGPLFMLTEPGQRPGRYMRIPENSDGPQP